MFDRVDDAYVATGESSKSWFFELLVYGRNDDESEAEAGNVAVEFGDGFRSREAARQAGEQVLAVYLGELDADTRARIKSNRQG